MPGAQVSRVSLVVGSVCSPVIVVEGPLHGGWFLGVFHHPCVLPCCFSRMLDGGGAVGCAGPRSAMVVKHHNTPVGSFMVLCRSCGFCSMQQHGHQVCVQGGGTVVEPQRHGVAHWGLHPESLCMQQQTPPRCQESCVCVYIAIVTTTEPESMLAYVL